MNSVISMPLILMVYPLPLAYEFASFGLCTLANRHRCDCGVPTRPRLTAYTAGSNGARARCSNKAYSACLPGCLSCCTGLARVSYSRIYTYIYIVYIRRWIDRYGMSHGHSCLEFRARRTSRCTQHLMTVHVWHLGLQLELLQSHLKVTS